MIAEKLNFLRETFPTRLKKLKGDEKPLWGKMNPQQMVEHMTGSFRIADEKIIQEIKTPPDRLASYKTFMMSEKEFRPNTRNALMGEEPEPVVNENFEKAVSELEQEINDFIEYFRDQPGKSTTNGVFGDLVFEEWVQLLHKHSVHHLKQFGLLPSP